LVRQNLAKKVIANNNESYYEFLNKPQKPEVQSDKPKRDRKSKPRVDYSKSEDEDLSFDTESNQPEVKTAEEKAKDDLVKPTSNLESSTGEFMKESSD
jgi:phage protein D